MGFIKDTDGIARSLKSDKDITYRYANSDVATFLPTNVANIGGASLTLTGALIAGVQNISGPGAVDVTTLLTQITTTGTDAYSLANGTLGQIKMISMVGDGGNGTLTPTTFANGTQIVFNDVNDTVTLVYGGNGWVTMALQGAIQS